MKKQNLLENDERLKKSRELAQNALKLGNKFKSFGFSEKTGHYLKNGTWLHGNIEHQTLINFLLKGKEIGYSVEEKRYFVNCTINTPKIEIDNDAEFSYCKITNSKNVSCVCDVSIDFLNCQIERSFIHCTRPLDYQQGGTHINKSIVQHSQLLYINVESTNLYNCSLKSCITDYSQFDQCTINQSSIEYSNLISGQINDCKISNSVIRGGIYKKCTAVGNIWYDGTFVDGTWISGYWKGGKWMSGIIKIYILDIGPWIKIENNKKSVNSWARNVKIPIGHRREEVNVRTILDPRELVKKLREEHIDVRIMSFPQYKDYDVDENVICVIITDEKTKKRFKNTIENIVKK